MLQTGKQTPLGRQEAGARGGRDPCPCQDFPRLQEGKLAAHTPALRERSAWHTCSSGEWLVHMCVRACSVASVLSNSL